jgi:hypothetical protein
VLCCSSVKDHSGYSPSSRRAPSQNSQQRCYTSVRLGALVRFAPGYTEYILPFGGSFHLNAIDDRKNRAESEYRAW